MRLFAIFALPLLAQDPRVPIDNEQVKVIKVTQQPHVKTKPHDHKVNRVMVYLDPGTQNFDYEKKGKSVVKWKAGEALWSPAAGTHVAEIVSDKPVTIVEIELKKPGGKAKAGATPLDPPKIDPKHYKVEFENEQVRVLRVKIGGKETAPMHEHLLGRVVVYLTDQDFKVTNADGKAEMVKHKAGESSWGGAAKHKEENLSDKPFEVLVVETKG